MDVTGPAADQRIEQPQPPPEEAPRAHRRRIALRVVIAILAIPVLIWLVLFITKGRFLKHPFERFVASQTHRTVKVGGDFQLYFAPFTIKFVAEKFTVSNPAWASRPYLFKSDRLDTRIAPLSLIFGKRHFYWLDLAQGSVDLEWNAVHDENTWTVSKTKGGTPLAFPRIDVAGDLPSIAGIEGVPLQTRARGRNMAGLLDIIGVVIPNTRRYALKAQLVQQGTEYRFTRLSGTFGNSDLAGRLTVTNGDRLKLDSVLATRRLDIVDAAPFLGYNPDIVAAKGTVAAAAATGAAQGRMLPDAKLPIATMQRFDADLKWTVGGVRSKNVPVSNVDLTLTLDHGRLALSPLTWTMARGNVAADLIFDTRQRPAADRYDIRLSPTPMGRLLAGYGVAEAGTTGVVKGRIQLAGRGDTIHESLSTANGRIAVILPQGQFWTRNVQLSELDVGTFVQKMFQDRLKEPVRINCGLIGFTVRSGMAAADPILIDTTKNVILGRGGFSFRDEAVDIAVRADSKKFSLFSGQSPIGVKGSFARPGLQVISPELLGRAGMGLGLAIAATPLAGVLAFVDVGDAKAAACGPVLAGATAQAQRTARGKPRDDVGHGTSAKDEDGDGKPAIKATGKKKVLGIF